MKKIKEFFKKFFCKFCLDKKFNSICITLIELPIFIIGIILKKYNLIIYTCIGLCILNIVLKKVYQSYIVRNLKKYVDINNNEEEIVDDHGSNN